MKSKKPLKIKGFSGQYLFYRPVMVAEVGFEPHDLRVMSPTSYQAALLRDIDFRLPFGAGDRGRTGTILSYHGILSPGRLPIPPHRQIACQGSFLPLAYYIISHSDASVNPFFAFPKTFLFFALALSIFVALFLWYAKGKWNMQILMAFFCDFFTFVHIVEKHLFAYFHLTRFPQKFSTGCVSDKPLKTHDFLSFPQFQQVFPQFCTGLSKIRVNVKIA